MRSLADIRATAEAATPGPLAVYDPNEGSAGPLWCVANDAYHNPPADDDLWPAVGLIVECGTREDAEFYANARQDVPQMADALEAANAEIARLRAQVDAMGYRLAEQRLDEAANNARYGYGGII